MTASAFIGFALVLAIAVVAAVVITMAALGKRRRARPFDEAAADDSPTGYTPGVWLLGGDESAAPRGHRHSHYGHGHHHDAHGPDAGGAHGADAGSGDPGSGDPGSDAGGGDAGGGGDSGGAH